MAKRSAQDTAAAKAKKQKMILIVGGVLLLAVAAFQVPKLMKGGGSAAAPASTRRVRLLRRSVAGAPVPVAAAAVPTKGSAVVAGVALPRARAVKVETSQLASFTLFEVKDPFVPQVGDEDNCRRRVLQPSRAPPADTGAGTDGHGYFGTGSTAARSPPADTTPAAPPAPIVYATIDFNTKPQQVQVKGTFPTPEPTVRPPLADEEAGEDQRRRRIVRRRQACDPEARQEGDARQHGDRRPLRAEADLHGRAARGHRGLHDRRRPADGAAATTTTP